MARKNLLLSISEKKLTAVNSDQIAPAPRSPPLAFAGRGALGAVTRTIDDLAAKAELAKDLETRLAAGEVIVELDPDQIDGSIVTDRMSADDENYRLLLEGIRAKGQDSPILVRPHPTSIGRYQVAFGHRRLRAATDLGRPVRAIVRDLSDRDLVVAQGQENSARADLSYIERARFAWQLEARGYDRETIISSLSADKTTISRMISVVALIPEEVITAIGPAPSTGRDRWLELAALFKAHPESQAHISLFGHPAFISASSDDRFNQITDRLSAAPDSANPHKPGANRTLRARGRARYWGPPGGTRMAKITTNEQAFVLALDQHAAPGFGDFLLGELDQLYQTFAKKRGE
jgi:ParB family transcriptional regulator, chromosome partitioning protein